MRCHSNLNPSGPKEVILTNSATVSYLPVSWSASCFHLFLGTSLHSSFNGNQQLHTAVPLPSSIKFTKTAAHFQLTVRLRVPTSSSTDSSASVRGSPAQSQVHYCKRGCFLCGQYRNEVRPRSATSWHYRH